MALPLDIRDLVKSSASLRAEQERPVRLLVIVDAAASDELVDAVRGALVPQSGMASIAVAAVVAGEAAAVSDADALVAVCGPGDTLAPTLANARAAFVPAVAVCVPDDAVGVARRLGHPVLSVVASDEVATALEHLGKWLADKIPAKRLALAANFPFVRRAVAVEAIRATAFQNGVIGGVLIIPGADMPLMTANQAKMVMQIAAAYGQPLGADRLRELAAVIGGAFVFRTVARQAVGLLPGFGWALKAGVGYSGTIAMGHAAIEYFESGADIDGLFARIKQARDSVVSRALRMRHKAGDETSPSA